MMRAGLPKSNQVVFLGDFLRSPHTHFAFRVLYRLLSNPIASVTGIMPKFFYSLTSDFNSHIRKIEELDISTTQSWIQLQEETVELPQWIQSLLPSEGDLVIGFEIAPSMCIWLSKHGIPYMNFFVHPVRFLPDLLFAVSTNNNAISKVLHRWSFQLDCAYDYANVLRALCIGDIADQAFIQSGTAMFVGQTSNDASVIQAGKTVKVRDYCARIQELTAQCSDILICPHPLGMADQMIYLLRNLGRGTIVNFNSYSLLSNENIKLVLTLSSSLGVEAKYFNKDVHFLLGEPLRPGGAMVASDANVHSLGHSILSVDFWKQIFGLNRLIPKGNCATSEFKAPNLFRSLFGAWAYDQLDPILRRKVSVQSTVVPPRPWKQINYNNLRKQVTTIDFRSSGNSFLYTCDGFHAAEDWGTWVDGCCAELIIPSEAICQPAFIQFKLQAYVNSLLPQQHIKVTVNKQAVTEFFISLSDNQPFLINLALPEQCDNFYLLQFEIPNAKSPQELGLSDETRKLGLGFIEAAFIDM
ncbi:hypothetical protein SOV_46270 [Sporomusa ovata DSM 2662]|uniref:Uncharacterized protein n=2 Tax=Sporomusa ovata TaxID=2378 RepID=A0A0U1KUI3_9FIRM|nr:hypothetical protein [Sporomusa ovata]EQB27015.1 hypothetical protein SOV_3c08890 [Sporomusa ovata DSM 2662]CQR71120.1 hypothetical protein SpAn4DRAFT_2098 [Sporomusa ovata]